jgi:hypothetical protein
MAEEGLKIKIGADVVEVVQSLNQLQTEFNDLNKQIKNVVPGSTQFNNLSDQLEILKIKIKAVNDASTNTGLTGLKTLTNETGKANIALINFGRVIQDAPFGIIGIANNIDPLLSSFQSLKKETGSSGAAFKALIGSLTGPAGVAIAVSSVTSLLIAFGPKISDFISGVSSTQKVLDEIAGQTAEAFKKAQLEFEKLSNIVSSSSSTFEQQQNALNKVNSSLSSYGVEIKNVADFQKNASQIGVLYAQIKQEEARGLSLASEAAKEYAKQVIAEATAKKAATALVDLNINANRSLSDAYSALVNTIKVYNEQSNIKTAKENQQAYASAITASNANLQKLLAELSKVPGITTIATKTQNDYNKSTKKAADNVDEIGNLIKSYKKELSGINWDQQNRQIDGTKKRVELAGNTLKDLYLLGVKETQQAWIDVKGDFDKFLSVYEKFVRDQRLLEANKNIRDIIKEQNEELSKRTAEKDTLRLQALGKQLEKNYKNAILSAEALNKRNQELVNSLSDKLAPIVENIFTAAAKGESIFDAVKNSVSDLILEIGKLIIKQAIFNALSKAFPAISAGQIVSGQASAAAGFARGDLFSFLLGRGR